VHDGFLEKWENISRHFRGSLYRRNGDRRDRIELRRVTARSGSSEFSARLLRQ
jgi:hypothetical protein